MKQIGRREAVEKQIDILSKVIGILTSTIETYVVGSEELVKQTRQTVVTCLTAIMAEVRV